MKNTVLAAAGGALTAMLLLSQPGVAREENPGMTKQAVPSMKPAAKEKTKNVAPLTVGAVPNPGAKALGTAQAAPSKLPAPKATPEAVDSHQGMAGGGHVAQTQSKQ